MCQTPDWSVGDRYLRENVPELAPLVDRYSPCPLKPKSKEVYFTILLTGIIAQQLPPDVSQQLMKKLEGLTGNPITPQAVLAASAEDLLSIGLVKQKIDYLRSFAEAVINGSVTMDKFDDMTDGQITKQLNPRPRPMDYRNVSAAGSVPHGRCTQFRLYLQERAAKNA